MVDHRSACRCCSRSSLPRSRDASGCRRAAALPAGRGRDRRDRRGAGPRVVAAVGGVPARSTGSSRRRIHTFTIDEGENLLALVVFLVVAAVVSVLVDRRGAPQSARPRGRGPRPRRSLVAGGTAACARPTRLPTSARQLARRRSASRRCAVLRRSGDGWTRRGVGRRARARARPTTATLTRPARRRTQCSSSSADGARAEDRSCSHAFAAQLAARRRAPSAARRGRGRGGAGGGERAAHRAARAPCRHDLRTPLASIKASATSLLPSDVDWTPDAAAEFLADDRRGEPTGSTTLVGNLLDMSRLQTGALQLDLRAVGARGGRRRPRSASLGDARRRRRGRRSRDAAARARRSRAARAGGREPRRQRAAPGRRPAQPVRVEARRGRRPRRPARRRRGPGIRAESTASGCSSRSSGSATSRNGDRGRARPGRRPGLRRGDGRRAHGRGHARRRAHDGREPPGPRSTPMTRVLVVDDEPQILRALGINLKARGYEVDLAATGEDGARPRGAPPSRRRRARPRPAGHRRRRGDPGAARLDAGADHRALGARRRAATRSPRSMPARTTT